MKANNLLKLNLIQKVRLYWRLGWNYISVWAVYFLTSKIDDKLGYKTVIFDFTSIFSERSYTQLIYFFAHNGYKIYLKNNPLFIANSVQFGKSIAAIKSLFLMHKLKKIDALYFYDYDKELDLGYKKSIRISYDMMSNEAIANKDKIVPYPMYPGLYFSGIQDQIYSLRQAKKSIRIFFSGNQNPKDYNFKRFQSFHQKLNRVKILNVLQRSLNDDEIEIVNDINKINAEVFINKFVLFKWSRYSLKEKYINGRILDTNWLNFLSKAQFFLACPGIVHPLCHNVIEAMSVGVIPILEHPEMFYPTLEHNVNCIVFRGEKDLTDKIRWVINMENEEVVSLSKNVKEYYDNYLSAEAFCDKIERLAENKVTFFINTDSYFLKKLSEANNE